MDLLLPRHHRFNLLLPLPLNGWTIEVENMDLLLPNIRIILILPLPLNDWIVEVENMDLLLICINLPLPLNDPIQTLRLHFHPIPTNEKSQINVKSNVLVSQRETKIIH